MALDEFAAINLRPIEEERQEFHHKVLQHYNNNNYDLIPQIDEGKPFNGMVSSLTSLSIRRRGEPVVSAVIQPTKYLYGQAMRDYVKAENPTEKAMRAATPRMANVSLLAPVKMANKYFLLSQIKGDALGSGQLHAALVAGNIDVQHLGSANILQHALQAEMEDELGMKLPPHAFCYGLDEVPTGQYNFAAVAQGLELDAVLDAYSRRQSPEVKGLALLPIGKNLTYKAGGSVVVYKSTGKLLEDNLQTVAFRPYTTLLVEHFKKNGTRQLLERAGF